MRPMIRINSTESRSDKPKKVVMVKRKKTDAEIQNEDVAYSVPVD